MSWACRWVASVLTVSALSCGGPGDDGLEDAPLGGERFAVIAIVRSESKAPGADDEVQVTGFFARDRGFDRALILDLASLPDVPDARLLALETGRCEMREARSGQPPEADEFEAFVDFLDAGEIRLDFGEHGVQSMRRRPFAELWSSVNGVTYTASIPVELADQPLQIAGLGSPELGDFRVRRALPPVPTVRAVGHEPVTGAYASIDWADDLEVQWSAPVAEELGARLLISLEALQYDRTVALDCVVRDIGIAILPAAGVALVSQRATEDATVRLVVRRIARVPFAAAGMHQADAFFVSRNAVLLK